MGSANPTADPANVIQSLVYTLLDVFDATRDLYQTLRAKEKRDYEQSRRSRGYPRSRSVEYVDDEDLDNEDAIAMDKAAVTRQLDIGLQEIGPQFAIGDVLSQTGLQSQIITLQSAIITTFLYGPTSPDPISVQLSSIIDASRSAGTASVDILAAQHHRQLANLTPTPISVRSPVSRAGPTQAPPYPATAATGISSASTALIKSRHEPTSRRGSPMNTTMLEWQGKPKFDRSDTDTTSLTGPTSYGTQSAPHSLYCLYALDLQRHPKQPLSGSITHDSSPFCPYCKRALHLSPGKSWEIFKDDEGVERCFRIQNRFVAKCHRDTADGGYSCVLCSRSASVDTVCGDVKALIRHIWMDHDAGELELEEDVMEVSQEGLDDQRRDSGMGLGGRRSSRSSRRSVSLGPSRSQRRPPRFEREVETLEIRPPRHQG